MQRQSTPLLAKEIPLKRIGCALQAGYIILQALDAFDNDHLSGVAISPYQPGKYRRGLTELAEQVAVDFDGIKNEPRSAPRIEMLRIKIVQPDLIFPRRQALNGGKNSLLFNAIEPQQTPRILYLDNDFPAQFLSQDLLNKSRIGEHTDR